MKTNFENLSEFIDELKKANEIKYIDKTVSRIIEISRYTDQESKSPDGGKALFFKDVEGSPYPVATNLFGSPRRISMALGVEKLDDLADNVRKFIDLAPPERLSDMLGLLPTAFSVTRFFPKPFKGRKAPCQEIVQSGDEVDLDEIPVLKCWPKDGGPFITLPLVFTKSLTTGRRNVGMYRLQVYDKNTTGMHWHIHKDGSHYYREYCESGKRMPVAVAIGGDPATIFAATAPMPRNLDEMILAGFIRNKSVQMVKCKTIDMEVPANAEFVLEGYVEPGEMRIEGPFGDHTGYYSLEDEYPVFHVTTITRRKSPVYCATLVGRPPMEDCYLAKATERLFLPALQTVFPEIVDYWLPWEGVFHNIVVAAIDKEYPVHAKKAMNGLWGQGQMSFCKAIVIVDKSVNPQDSKAVMKALMENFDIKTDLMITEGVLDVLDHSSPTANFGGKIGIDLTERITGEPPRTPPLSYITEKEPNAGALWGTISAQIDGVTDIRHVARFESGDRIRNRILLVCVVKDDEHGGKYFADRLAGILARYPFNLILMYDDGVNLADNSYVLWKLFNNVDPRRDIYFYDHRLVIDACKKGVVDGHERPWPEELTFD